MLSGIKKPQGFLKQAQLTGVLLLFFLSSCQVSDYLYYNVADINDYRNFPFVTISRSAQPVAFDTSSQVFDILIKNPERENPDSVSLVSFLERSNTVSFIILHKDRVVFEHYFDRFTKESIIPSFSVTKSFVSALVGIALDEGVIRSLDQPITDYVSELRDTGFRNVTLRNLLEMRSGIKYNERYIDPFGNVAKFYYGHDLLKYVRDLKIDQPPDREYVYQSANTQLLAVALERATGKKLSDLLGEKIWHPVGMEYDATWSVDSPEHAEIKAFCCLNARTSDFARFGLLYLNRGIIGNDTIVPPAWIEETKKITQNSLDSQGYPYTYHWRITPEGEMFAKGVLGQYIFISPGKDLVIVRFGKSVGDVNWIRFFQQLAGMF